MANRYWVGGAGAWDTTVGTKWAATSGGVGGQSIPTSTDDVFFDAASGTVTVAVSGTKTIKSLNCTGFTGTLQSTGAITLSSGFFTLNSTMAYTHTGAITCNGGGTVTSAGKTLNALTTNAIVNGGFASTVQLADALNLTGALIVGGGTFTTNNFSVTASSLLSNGTTARTINLGSSTLTFSTTSQAVYLSVPTNLTFNAGTSQINVTASQAKIETSPTVNTTFYNVTYTSTTSTISTATTRTLIGLNTFNNLTVTGPSVVGHAELQFSQSQIINGTLATTGTTAIRRVFFRSNFNNHQRTLTINTAPSSLIDADFRDIIVNGAASPISGTRLGNRAYCSGITFSTPKTVYWNKSAGGSTADTDAWALTDGGAVNINNFPLPQDTMVFTNTSPSLGSGVNVGNISYIGTLDMSARTTSFTFSNSVVTEVYGDIKNSALINLGLGAELSFVSGKTQTFFSNGRTTSAPIRLNSFGGTLQLADAFSSTLATTSFSLTAGTFDTKNYTFSYNNTNTSFTCNGSEITGLKFGSSTVIFGSMNLSNSNLKFDAGTSEIKLIATGNIGILTGPQTFYNVSITPATGGVTRIISGSNTFNNLFLWRPNQTYADYSIGADQKVNGTLSSGVIAAVVTDGCSRLILRSDVEGTARTITCAAINSIDTDFRDIKLAGAAAGAAPTRAGDCGGNSGIVFPAAKTVYRLSNASWGNANSWAATSGGAADNVYFPLPQDTAIIDNASSNSVALDVPYSVGSINCSARTTAFSLSFTASTGIFGNFTLGSGITVLGTSTQVFRSRGTQTLTTAGKAITFAILINSLGKVQLGDALSTALGITLSSGEFDAVAYNVTCTTFTSTAGNRTLRMGSGLWTLTSTGAIWNIGGTFDLYKGTANILLSDTTVTSRTFSGSNLSYNKLTIGGATGISTTTLTGGMTFTELASTKTVAHTINWGVSSPTFGKWSVTGTVGNVVTVSGSGLPFLAGSATSGINYLSMGTAGFSSTSPGEFYSGANSTGTSSTVFKTAPPTPRTLYWVGGTGNWSDTTKWSLSSGGAGGQAIPTSLDNVIFDSASSAAGYSLTLNVIGRCKDLTISGPATGTLSWVNSQGICIHGNMTWPATGFAIGGGGTITLTGSTGTNTFTTNGNAITTAAITVNGIGCNWQLGSALNNTGVTLTVLNGSFNTQNYNLSANALSSSNSNTRSITLGSSSVTLAGGTTPLDFLNSVGLTFSAGTSTIGSTSGLSLSWNGGSQTFYNVSFASIGLGKIITGTNTFNNLLMFSSSNRADPLTLSANQTVNGTLTCTGLSPLARGFIKSDTIGTTRTITANAVTLSDFDFRDITIAGAGATNSNRLGDCGGNSGIVFPAAKTVYRVGLNTTWAGASSWALASGGTGSNDNFPLAQDTAIIDNNTELLNNFINLASYNIGTLDCSSRTNGITLNQDAAATRYGSYILGPGVNTSGSLTQTFSGRGTQTFTSAGKIIYFPVEVDTPTGTFKLGDSTNFGLSLNLTRGTLDANNYNVNVNQFISNTTNIRTLTMGSGLWLIESTIPWNVVGTNLTLNKGTADILLNSSGTTARTFTGGGLSYNKLISGGVGISTLTIDGNNSFTEIASTKTTAHTIYIGSSTQRVGAWTVKGSAGNIVTIDTATGVGNLVYTGEGNILGLDYLSVAGNAYGPNGEFLTGIWNVGSNSTNSLARGAGGWTFNPTVYSPTSRILSNFFLVF